MKTAINTAAQGDVLFIRVDAIPDTATLQPAADEYVVAHSETGHHHVAKRKGVSFYREDDLVGYLEFRGRLPIEHRREHHTHETIELLSSADAMTEKIDAALAENEEPARFKVIRQRQMTPEGWARVVD